MLPLLDSGKINKMICSFWTCVVSVPMSGRKKVAEAAIRAFSNFATTFFNERIWLVAVPGLLSTLAILCGEEDLLRNSHQIVNDIGRFTFYLTVLDSARATVLIDAGWADLLVKAIRARRDDAEAVELICTAIQSLLLLHDDSPCRTAFIKAGAIAVLQETIQNYSPKSNFPDKFITKQCNESLEMLMKESQCTIL